MKRVFIGCGCAIAILAIAWAFVVDNVLRVAIPLPAHSVDSQRGNNDVTIDVISESQCVINGHTVAISELADSLARLAATPDRRIIVQGREGAPFDAVVTVLIFVGKSKEVGLGLKFTARARKLPRMGSTNVTLAEEQIIGNKRLTSRYSQRLFLSRPVLAHVSRQKKPWLSIKR